MSAHYPFRGAAQIGNDLMSVGANGVPKIIEVSADVSRDFTRTDVLECQGIARRLRDLLRRNHEAIGELKSMGIDKRFLTDDLLKSIEKGDILPDWFKALERYAIVPEGGRALVPEGVTLIIVP